MGISTLGLPDYFKTTGLALVVVEDDDGELEVDGECDEGETGKRADFSDRLRPRATFDLRLPLHVWPFQLPTNGALNGEDDRQ